MNGNSSKLPTTPPLPLRGTSPRGGSEKSAPERGAAAVAAEGCGRHPRFNEIPGEYVTAPLASPRGKPRRILRIRPRFRRTITTYRETPLRLAKSRLTAVARLHSACASLSQPLRAASSPFRGAFGVHIQPPLPGEVGRTGAQFQVMGEPVSVMAMKVRPWVRKSCWPSAVRKRKGLRAPSHSQRMGMSLPPLAK